MAEATADLRKSMATSALGRTRRSSASEGKRERAIGQGAFATTATLHFIIPMLSAARSPSRAATPEDLLFRRMRARAQKVRFVFAGISLARSPPP